MTFVMNNNGFTIITYSVCAFDSFILRIFIHSFFEESGSVVPRKHTVQSYVLPVVPGEEFTQVSGGPCSTVLEFTFDHSDIAFN